MIFGLSEGQQNGFGPGVALVALAAAVVLAVGFVVTERTVAAPMLPLQVFATPTRRAAVAMMFLAGGIVAAYVYFLSIYLQRVEGFSPVGTGVALVPATLTVVLTSMFATGRLLPRLGVKRMLLVGLGLIALGQFWLAHISAGASYPVAVLPGLVLTALGMGLAFPTASVAITSGVAQRDQGVAGGLFATSQQAGSAVGLALLATVAAAESAHASGSLAAGYRLSFLIATGIAVLSAVIVASQLNPRACQHELERQQAAAGDGIAPGAQAGASVRRA